MAHPLRFVVLQAVLIAFAFGLGLIGRQGNETLPDWLYWGLSGALFALAAVMLATG